MTFDPTDDAVIDEPANSLVRYLQRAREAMVWKLDGLSDYDVRRPLTPSGTNLLGLVKHLATVEFYYFGDSFDRPHGQQLVWYSDDEPGADRNADMYATAEETREQLIDFYRRSWAFADATVRELPLDARGLVPWWPEQVQRPTLHRMLVHVLAETQRHAGHADILRETLDGAVGLRQEVPNMTDTDESPSAYVARLEELARSADS